MTSADMAPLGAVAFRFSGLYRDFFVALARLLKERHGSRLHLYYPRPEMGGELRAQLPDDLFDTLNFVAPAHPPSFDPDPDAAAVVAAARQHEQRYQRPYSWFAIPDRHFGRGFAPTGYHHPRSIQSERSGYLGYLDTYSKYFDFWEREFESKQIGLLINGDWRESAVARAHGAAITTPCSARHLNFHYWATDEFADCSHIVEAFATEAPAERDYDIAEGPFVQMSLGAHMRGRARLSSLARRISRKLYAYSRWKLTGHSKGRLYLVTDELGYFIREWRAARQMQGRGMARLQDVQDQPFVYYPLQVDPETGFQGRSPEHFHQHAAIISIASALPAGVRLVVKEHFPGLGLRPDRFYDQLRDIKNLVLLDIRENGLEVIRRCAAVATVNGSSGQEAAVMGKPVISFGRHNLYNVLPHVFVVTDESQIGGYLAAALAPDFDRADAARQGARYIAALEKLSFDLEHFNHFATAGFSNLALEDAYQKLLQNLGLQGGQTLPQADGEAEGAPAVAGTDR